MFPKPLGVRSRPAAVRLTPREDQPPATPISEGDYWGWLNYPGFPEGSTILGTSTKWSQGWLVNRFQCDFDLLPVATRTPTDNAGLDNQIRLNRPKDHGHKLRARLLISIDPPNWADSSVVRRNDDHGRLVEATTGLGDKVLPAHRSRRSDQRSARNAGHLQDP